MHSAPIVSDVLMVGGGHSHVLLIRMWAMQPIPGVRLTLVYDAALPGLLGRADRVWLGTEAIGAQAFLAAVGTRLLLQEAERLEVRSAVLATSDKLMPRGALAPPAWGARDGWLLWEDAPEGVRLESQPYEPVALDLPEFFITEHGAGSATDLALRALRTGSEA